ncbi:helix-turn-helix domain-containing protein [Marilutibacter maris]|uniref:Transcriptional regulator, MerR family n=1 Tax=Marilutibacter maris TaxID=1605891 RepID=A0A2U9T238_9GAMM|nr:transcriptional regulator, MerR family [Lysobacter maris]
MGGHANELDIAEVVRRSGLPASTLRHYEDKGLIAPVGRHGLRRQYAAGVLERLALIALGRAAGFSLDEIAPMLAADGRHRIDRAVLAQKAEALDATIHRLAAMRDGLRHAAACPAPSHMECPTFRRIVRAATSGVIAVPERARRKPGLPTPQPARKSRTRSASKGQSSSAPPSGSRNTGTRMP